MREELKKIKSLQKRPDGIFGSFMTRPFSHIIAYFSFRLNLSPNMVSFISLLFCASAVGLLIYSQKYCFLLISAFLWWMGGIFDAADGDLARYAGTGSDFGGWFDSLLDRCKEFSIFAVFGYVMLVKTGNNLYFLFTVLSIFSNVMSGWISDTKKLFVTEREPSIKFSSKYIFGMVDTRDFVVILSLCLSEFRIALLLYSTVFVLLVFIQAVQFFRKYGKTL